MIRPAALCLLVALVTHPTWSQEPLAKPSDGVREKLLVGKLGRPDALVFTGANAFPESQLREALARDFDVLLARDQEAKLAEYLEVLERRLTEGYKKSGFPHVKITATPDPATEQIQIAISEGEAFMTGQVKVDGSDAVSESVMARFLTESAAYPPKTMEKKLGQNNSVPTLWKSGQPADFYQHPVQTYEKAIQAGFAAQGYFFPEFDVEVKPGKNGQADLWIHVKETGTKATVGQVTVEGNFHHRPEQILEFLGINSGQKVDNLQKAAWEQKLLATQCFLGAEVLVMPTIAPGIPSDVVVRVVEQPYGPKIGDKLTAEDRHFLKLAEWMTQWSDGKAGDCVLCFRGEKETVDFRIFAAISPQNGVVLDVELKIAELPEPLRYTVLISEENSRVVCWHQERILVANGIQQQATFNILLDFFERPEGKGLPGERNFRPNFEFKSFPGPTDLQFKIVMPSATAISLGRGSLGQCKVHEGVVEFDNSRFAAQFETETGRMIGIWPSNSQTSIAEVRKAILPKVEKQEGFLYFEPGAFERFVADLNQKSEAFSPSYNPQRPISSVSEFVLGELEWMCRSAHYETPLPVALKLLQLDAIKPLDQLWVEKHSGAEEPVAFDLPLSSKAQPKFFGLEHKIPFGFGQPLGRLIFNLHGLLVPPESGPGRVAWNLALFCAGRFGDAITNLDHLAASPEVGPLSCCYASVVFGLLNQEWGQRFAAEGLKKLEPNQFRYEIDRLLPAESLLFELVESFGNAVRQLDDDEFAQLALLLGEDSKHPAVPKLIETLRQEKGTPSRTLVLDSLVTLWTIRGQAECRKHLEKLVGPTPEVSNPDNYNDLNLDALFPEKKPKEEKPGDEALESKFKLIGGEQTPFSNP